MLENVTELDYQNKRIILIATAHVSKESVELVKQVIETERPDSICIELDEDRYHSIQNPNAWESTDLVQVIKSKKVGFLVANLALGSYQRKIAKQLNTSVGGEMIQGINSAKEIGATLVLADRKVQTTFLRIWRKLSLWEKNKLIISLLFTSGDDTSVSSQDFQELLKTDMLESVLHDIRKNYPKVGDILISERDQYLAAKIKEAPGNKIVAVLGGAHVPGVQKEIYRLQDIDSISSVPPKSLVSKTVSYMIPAAIMALFLYAFFVNIQTGLEQLSAWALWTGILAALFTALSLAHPLSIITSLVVAPFTTINPVLACGLFTGLVEAKIKKPTVYDIKKIPEDIFSFKGFFRNRFLRTILVVFMANIGASLGTFVAGADIISNLF